MSDSATCSPCRAALDKALRIMRDDATNQIECGSVCPIRGGGPRPGSIDSESLRLVTPVIDAIRECERLAGRPDDDGPQWLNDILDGRRPL